MPGIRHDRNFRTCCLHCWLALINSVCWPQLDNSRGAVACAAISPSVPDCHRDSFLQVRHVHDGDLVASQLPRTSCVEIRVS